MFSKVLKLIFEFLFLNESKKRKKRKKYKIGTRLSYQFLSISFKIIIMKEFITPNELFEFLYL